MLLRTLLVASCCFASVAMADQWDDTFNSLVAGKSNLPYKLDENYSIFDISYDSKQRIFANHIQTTKQMTKETIQATFNKDIPNFCADPDNKASLNDTISYQFIFYKDQTANPFFTIDINKSVCDNLLETKVNK